MEKIYDLIIIGAGPAGLSASIYASRYKLDHLVFGNEIGGQITEAWEIENYPGFESISGKDLMEKFKNQVEKLGAKIEQVNISKVEKSGENFQIEDNKGEKYFSKTVIFALGMKAKKAEIPGEEDFIGKGVSYCAICDAMFFKGKEVVVIGGGNSAATSALHLAEFADKVTLLYRGEKLKADPAWISKMEKNPKIEIICCAQTKKIKGENKVSGIEYEMNRELARNASHKKTGEHSDAGGEKELAVQGVFVEVGTVPGVAIAKELGIETDEQDYIIIDQNQKTNIENAYAAGDVTTGSNKFRQVITAAAEGAIASGSIYKKLRLDN